MPFWVVLDHDAVMRIVTISSCLFAALLAILAVWLGYREVRRWNWHFNWKCEPRNERVILITQIIATPIFLVALPLAAGILGYQFGALFGFIIGYAAIPIAYGSLLAFGALIAISHLPCRRKN